MSLGSAELGGPASELATIELGALGTGGGGPVTPTGGVRFVNFTRVVNPRYVNTMYSKYSGIILDAPKFENTTTSQNKINLYKTMTRVAYTYVQSNSRVSFRYDYTIDRLKSLELRNFIRANIAQQIILTTWDNKIYVGVFGTNPVEFSSDRRWGHANDAVTVTIEFQGIKISG